MNTNGDHDADKNGNANDTDQHRHNNDTDPTTGPGATTTPTQHDDTCSQHIAQPNHRNSIKTMFSLQVWFDMVKN
jgi:hypothetical protein